MRVYYFLPYFYVLLFIYLRELRLKSLYYTRIIYLSDQQFSVFCYTLDAIYLYIEVKLITS